MKNFNDLISWRAYGSNEKVFDDHIAKSIKLPTGENDVFIHFQSPKTSNGWMNFIYCNGVLSIQGDYGNASFCWYNKRNTIEVLAGFAHNFHYFLSKLVSSEGNDIGGTLLQEYDSDECIKDVENYFKENDLTILEDWEDDWQSNTSDHIEWITFCRENGAEFFQDEDYWEYAYSFGRYTVDRAYLYAYGLIKAVEYLENDNKENKCTDTQDMK